MARLLDVSLTPDEEHEVLVAREAAYLAANPVAPPARPKDGRWVPACGGTETPFKARSGATLLYCWNPVTGQHAYVDCGSDMVLSNEEAFAHMEAR